MTTSPEVGASLAAETLRARAAAMRICSSDRNYALTMPLASLLSGGRDGSNLPFSTALIELRETPTFSASSAWLQPFSALRTRMRRRARVTVISRHGLDGGAGRRTVMGRTRSPQPSPAPA